MTTVSVQEAQERLPELIQRLFSGDELVITKDDHPVAKLTRTNTREPVQTCTSGDLWLAYDVNLEDLRAYAD